ncbi:helix-turn-helix transcriptional regulator [Nonomuraea roseoviolacea]|uniref:Transcriptional regulator with XRE-family HTH domain/tetratricopeptide (TPR) repeat protein n=1 Tax=Nonomuraea roseoviolacea subsp. carminata TaxID=160689 RepID=A0ABT1K5K0_9ACTN|nr:helix-turn-helix transcriptional regulator [Nonomuraea roseoviolacea]MCP2349283.1 transcriptional regulator with XRE-family HTH domain/tetratricopeptide (TPR) repeat protein [Nonomuraea roseoviolacea subsp. carminata]
MPKAGMNVRLRDWRQKAGLTRAEMAKMVNLSESGVKHSLTCDEERIRRWEAGEVSWPREEYRLALAEITRLAPEDLGFVPIRRSRARAAPADEAADETISAQSAHDFPLWQAGLNFPPLRDKQELELQLPPVADEETLVVPGRAPDGRIVFLSVSRRTFLQGLGIGLAGITPPQSRSPYMSPARRLASATGDVNPIEHLYQVRQVLIANDNLLGPLNAIPAVQQQITAIQQLRQETRGADRHQLLKLQAEYSEFCGWLYHDAGDFHTAQYWTDRALELSHAIADRDMTAYIMARKSQLAGDIGDPVTAVDMAEAAGNLARPGSRLQALAPTYAGYGHALHRDDGAARHELDRAHQLLLDIADDPDSPWAVWLDEPYLQAQRARSNAALGRFGEAVEGFQQAIAAVPQSFRRDRGVYLSRQALAHAGAEEPEHAAGVAMSALYIAEETGSARIMNELLRLDRHLDRWRSTPLVAEFHTALRSTVVKQA